MEVVQGRHAGDAGLSQGWHTLPGQMLYCLQNKVYILYISRIPDGEHLFVKRCVLFLKVRMINQ